MKGLDIAKILNKISPGFRTKNREYENKKIEIEGIRHDKEIRQRVQDSNRKNDSRKR